MRVILKRMLRRDQAASDGFLVSHGRMLSHCARAVNERYLSVQSSLVVCTDLFSLCTYELLRSIAIYLALVVGHARMLIITAPRLH